MTITAQKGVFSYALQSTKYGNGTLVARKAKARISLTANPTAGDTITVGTTVYTFETSVALANDVKIGLTATATASNLAAAIAFGAGIGTLYGTGTVINALFDAVASFQTVFLVAKTAGAAGNLLALTKVSTAITLTAPEGGITAGAFDTTAPSYDRHRAMDINYEAIQNQQIFPQEIGGIDVPVGSYKTMVFVAGGATLNPRLAGSFGEILLATLGQAVTVANSPEAGVNTHTFGLRPDGEIPWMAVRKHIPGNNQIRAKGLTGYDNKVGSLRIMVPQTGLVASRVDFMGRIPKWDNYPEAWLYEGGFEESPSAPLSCKGYFKMPTINAGEQPITGLVLDMTNNLTTAQEEAIVGSYNPDDIIVRNRVLTLRFTYKWYDPEMYERVFTGAVNGVDWSPEPFETTKSGSDYAFEVRVEGPSVIGASTTPYSLTVRGSRVSWQVASEVKMQAGGILTQDYVGTVLVPLVEGDPYCEFILVNDDAGYAIPAQA